MSQFETQIARLQKEIDQKRQDINRWENEMARTADGMKRASLVGHITRAKLDIQGLEHSIYNLEEAIERSGRNKDEKVR